MWPCHTCVRSTLHELHEGWTARIVADRAGLSAMLGELLQSNRYGAVYTEGLADGMTGAAGFLHALVHACRL